MKRLAERLIAFCVPPWAADAVLGDLDEEFARISASRGRRAATRWFLLQALVLAARYAPHRRHPAQRSAEAGARSGRVRLLFDDLRQDTRIAVRQLRRSPVFAVTAVATLAVGIVANALVFTLVNATLLKSVTTVEEERVARLSVRAETAQTPSTTFSYPEFAALRTASPLLSEVAAVHLATVALRADTVNDQLLGEVGSAEYFRIMAPRIILGRGLTDSDDGRNASPAVLLSERYWRRRFDADPAVIGRALQLNGRHFTVAGVADRRFFGSFIGAPVDLWVALEPSLSFFGDRATTAVSPRPFQLLARLRPGATHEQARDSMAAQEAAIAELRGVRGSVRIEVAPATLLHGGARTMVTVLLALLGGLALAVLLVAASNVANLLLARSVGRRREFAVRISLGAGRSRVLRQLAAEGLLLSVLAAAVALAAGYWTTRALDAVALLPGFELRLDLTTDARVVTVTGVVALVAALITIVAPALSSVSHAPSDVLKEGGASIGSVRTARLRSALVVVQIAIATTAAITAGLLTKSARAAAATDLGFRTENAFATDIDLTAAGYSPDRARVFYEQLLARVSAIPGVDSVALASRAPLDSSTPVLRLSPDGAAAADRGGARLEVSYYVVGGAYFETVDIPLVAGRPFDRRDSARERPLVIVNDVLAGRLWPRQDVRDAIGRRITVSRATGAPVDGAAEIIGIARSAKYRTVGETPQPHAYFLLDQTRDMDMALLVHGIGQPMSEAQAAIAAVDPRIQGFFTRTLAQHTGVSLAPARLAGTTAAAVGLVAIGLGVMGLYGVIACLASERRREFAVRLALGASPRQVVTLVLRQAAVLAAVGTVIGGSVSLAAARVLTGFLYYVSPYDPAVFATVVGCAGIVSLLASWLPAWRVSRVPPLAALRQ